MRIRVLQIVIKTYICIYASTGATSRSFNVELLNEAHMKIRLPHKTGNTYERLSCPAFGPTHRKKQTINGYNN